MSLKLVDTECEVFGRTSMQRPSLTQSLRLHEPLPALAAVDLPPAEPAPGLPLRQGCFLVATVRLPQVG